MMLSPATTGETAAIVRLCAAEGVALTVQGGNTGLVGGQIPQGEVLLSTRRMRTIRDVDPVDDVLVAEAGVTLAEVQAAAAEAGRRFPLSLASEGTATLGGVVSTNAGGVAVLRFGTARDLILGLEAVLPNGEIWGGLRRLRKDNTGYDLKGLLSGAEGTLGIITAATLKLFPQPAATVTAMAACATLEAAVELLGLARNRLDAALTGFEVMNRFSLDLVARHFPALPQPLPTAAWTVLLEQSDAEGEAAARTRFENLLGAALEDGCVEDAVVAESLAQSRALWHVREAIPMAQAEEGLNIKHDISVPVSAIPRFVRQTDAALERHLPGIRLVNFGHLGDGNLHYNVQAPAGDDARTFLQMQETRINQIVYDAVQVFGGSISAEHGVGQLKREELRLRKSAVALDLMRQIKAALDPTGLMNPGRLL